MLLAIQPTAAQPVSQESADGKRASLIAAADLYRAQTIVTGQGEANRIIGFASCLEDVLVKVSGALRLAGDPRLAPYKSEAAKLVRGFSYRDEKGGKPKNDEQGTRDRSFFLAVDFDEAAINEILAAMGVTPWLSRRPVLGVFVEMQQGPRRYVVAADSRQTDLQGAALLSAAAKRGMPIMLPDVATLDEVGANDMVLAAIAPGKLAQAAARRGGEVLLTARLAWDDQDLRWTADWQLDWHGKPQRWRLSAVTFDEAFRQGIGGAAQIIAAQQ
ncbi:DUF2066 domain-containing protein [Bradyrhizobium sp.]|uniref:DUF2066 domain-containing protein n=1 Tax=Bradyrhizobium sp. TaxID=376 RepID=UPI001DE9FB4A|nr:DUF2066 domain-containing protein [Bradyrhizobium sp.]MBI5322477.1 DUF2066 domain-containing protein [Bradyrhizobium sp.]